MKYLISKVKDHKKSSEKKARGRKRASPRGVRASKRAGVSKPVSCREFHLCAIAEVSFLLFLLGRHIFS